MTASSAAARTSLPFALSTSFDRSLVTAAAVFSARSSARASFFSADAVALATSLATLSGDSALLQPASTNIAATAAANKKLPLIMAFSHSGVINHTQHRGLELPDPAYTPSARGVPCRSAGGGTD